MGFAINVTLGIERFTFCDVGDKGTNKKMKGLHSYRGVD